MEAEVSDLLQALAEQGGADEQKKQALDNAVKRDMARSKAVEGAGKSESDRVLLLYDQLSCEYAVEELICSKGKI